MKCLTIICAVVSLLLGFTYTVTSPIIEEANIKAANEARMTVLPNSSEFKKVEFEYDGLIEIYEETGGGGYTVTATASGYGGAVDVMVGLNRDGDITGIKVLNHKETQGIGTKVVAGEKYLSQYTEVNVFADDEVDANTSATPTLSSVDAVTGATVTSNAVAKAVSIAVDVYKQVRGYN